MFSYVDDFSLTVWSPSYRANTRHLRCWAEDLRYQAAKIRLDFSLPKTELIHWRTNQQSGTRCTRPITVGGITTNPMRVVRWLGFWLEDNSSTVSHFTRRLALAAAALTTVKGLSQYGKGLNPRACRHIAQVLVRPILLYGANLLTPTKGVLRKMDALWHRVARWVTTCFYRTNTSALLAEACLPPLNITIDGLQVAYTARIAGTFPSQNPASARLPPDFPTPWALQTPKRENFFVGVKGIYRPLPWRTARRYGEPRIRLPMDEVAHRLVPLLNTLDIVQPEQHGMPPYKRSYPMDTPLLPHYTLKAFQEHSAASSHLNWGLHLARTAPDYPYPAPTRPHRFMHLGKFQASRIHQMRSGISYLAAQPTPYELDQDRTCRLCLEEEETFHHAAITCSKRERDRKDLCPNLLSVAPDSQLWKSFEDLKQFGTFIFRSQINFPPT